MKNYVAAGSAIAVPAPAAVSSGAGVLVGSIFGVANGSATLGADVVLAVVGVVDLPKAAEAITLGAALYWDDTVKTVTTTASGNTRIGAAVAAAQSGAATVRVRLSGVF